jgi:signal recognition particle subunit SRP54
VSEVIQQLFTMRARMQNLSAIMTGKAAMPGMGGLQEAITGGRKAAPGTAKRKKKRSLFDASSEVRRQPVAVGRK